jgi:hypothetical protein
MTTTTTKHPYKFEIRYQDMSLFEKEAKEQIQLFFSRVKITVEDLISSRVRREIAKYNHKALAKEKLLIANHPLGASQPTDLVHTIQDPEKMVSLALQAFEQNQFILLVGLQDATKQVESLKQEVLIQKDTVATFIKLVPLIGG